MKSYSTDLRERVIAAVEARRLSRAAIAVMFAISEPTLNRWWGRWRKEHTVTPRPHGGGNPHVLADCESFLRAAVKKDPDASLEELCALVQKEKGLTVSQSMMCRELQRLNLPRKKRRRMTANGTRPG
jgi:transposase